MSIDFRFQPGPPAKDSSFVTGIVTSPKKQLAFALLVFERMLPSLVAFSKDTGFDCSCYLQAREVSWRALQGGEVSGDLVQNCLDAAPDTEEFSHKLTSYALNAALAISDIVEFIRAGGTEQVAHVLTLARDSIHLYLSGLEVSVVSSPKKDAWIANHPLMQQEQRREEEEIEFLRSLPEDFDMKVVSSLRQRATNQPPLLPLS
jgi:uncharacterized protein